jgi:hypothetical protein
MGTKNKNLTEMDMLLFAIDRLKEMADIAGTIKPGRKGEDARLVLKTLNRKGRVEFVVEVRRTAQTAAAVQPPATNDPYILVTNYINPDQAERFRKIGTQFLDCAGNAYINTAAIFLFIKGNKPDNKLNIQPNRLFKPGGLQVVFTVLCNPDLATATYRDIAVKAGVALGTVAWAMKDLQKNGYIIDLGQKVRRLFKREALLKLWLIGYEQLLRPKLMVKRYHAEKQDLWREANIENALWGGEVAAQKMTGYLKPERMTLFADKLPDRLMFQYRLRPDPHGEIEVLTPFWNFDYPEKKEGIVPPLLVYADLMMHADGRTTETARMVYERYLARYFTEN